MKNFKNNLNDLYENFKKVYDELNAEMPFTNKNLFSTIHLSENDHTNILWDIIMYRKNGEYIFFDSFIKKCLLIEDFEMNVEKVSENKATQNKALANNKRGTGFIDLILKDEERAVIIENKVCNAGDVKNQLARYFYTYADIGKDSDFLSAAGIIQANKTAQPIDDDKIYMVYLTRDESKRFPEEKSQSLPDYLKKRLKLVDANDNVIKTNKTDISIPKKSHYIHISYSENVVNWIKENVLPEISAYNSNEFYQSVVLYVNYLENDLLGQTPKSMDIYTEKRYNDIVQNCLWQELYKELITLNTNKIEDTDSYITPYVNFLKAQVTRIVNQSIQTEGWESYCTPSFALFYKKEWHDSVSEGYIPNIDYRLSSSALLNSKNKKTVYFEIEHYNEQNLPNWKKALNNYLCEDEELKDNFKQYGKTPQVKFEGADIVTIEGNKITISPNPKIEDHIVSCGFNNR